MTPTDLLLWRTQRRLTKRELAHQLEINPRTIWAWENGVHSLPANLDEQLATLAIEPSLYHKRKIDDGGA